MKITDEHAVLIKNLHLSNCWSSRKLLNEFANKGWKLGSIDYLLKKICKTGTVNRQPDSGELAELCKITKSCLQLNLRIFRFNNFPR